MIDPADLNGLTESHLKRCILGLDHEVDKFHKAARWLLGICVMLFAVVLALLWRIAE